MDEAPVAELAPAMLTAPRLMPVPSTIASAVAGSFFERSQP
jgi:hypothetical protein